MLFRSLVDETPNERGKRRIIERLHFDGVAYTNPNDGSFKFVMGDKTRAENNKYLEDYEGDLFGIVGGDEIGRASCRERV